MLKPLRLKLTLTFLAATLALILLVGGSAYAGLFNYFEQAVDLNLMSRMAAQFQLFGFPLPDELQESERAWLAQQVGGNSGLLANPGALSEDENNSGESGQSEGEGENENENENDIEHILHELSELSYGSDSLLIFVLPLDENGNLIFNPNPYPLPMEPDLASSQAALANGSDLRFSQLPGGERVRLLSYRTVRGENPAVLQLGRVLTDQDKVLAQVAISSSIAGILILSLVGVGSWWLVSRTLVPAQYAWDQQQTFVANASHELRTPLTLMRASTEVALRGNVGEKEARLLTDVLNETDYMGRLVGDLLLLSRLDAKELPLQLESVSLSSLLEDIQLQVKKLPWGDQVVVEKDSLDAQVWADRVRLRQVLLILLDNATKHTPSETKVYVRSKIQARHVKVLVEDQGQGIPTTHLEHIFERFYRFERRTVEGHSNGLGLSIAKSLIELHGGTIRVESEMGRGTLFAISFPRLNEKIAG